MTFSLFHALVWKAVPVAGPGSDTLTVGLLTFVNRQDVKKKFVSF